MRRTDVVFVAGAIVPPVSFSGLAVVAAVAFLVPLLLGLVPQLRLPSAVVEIVVGIVIGPSVLGWVKDDLAIHVVALMGLAVLLFLAGLEIDFARLCGPLLRISSAAFVLSLLLSQLVSFGLKAMGLIIDAPLIAIILASTSLGIVVPVLKDAGHSSSDFGQLVMGAASLAEVGPIVLLSLFFSGATTNIGAHVLVLAFLIILAAAVGFSMTRAARIAVLSTDLRRLEDTTAQIRVRGAIMLVAAMGAVLVAVDLGQQPHLMTVLTGSALTATALLSSLLFPGVALTFLGKEESRAVQAGVASR
jgi:Kef-type K+ transport system membrane component KefB